MLFATPRFNVRPLTQSDLPWMVELEGNSDVMRYTDQPPQSYEQTQQAVTALANKTSLNGELRVWAIEAKDNGCIGTVAVRLTEQSEWELGYRLLPKHWGQGFGTEVIAGLVAYLQPQLPGEALHIFAYKDNVSSCRIAHKLGFELKREWLNTDSGLIDRHYVLAAL